MRNLFIAACVIASIAVARPAQAQLPQQTANLQIVSGNNQAIIQKLLPPGQVSGVYAASAPLVVKALDSTGAPIPNTYVTFTASVNDFAGYLNNVNPAQPLYALTDSNGNATAVFTVFPAMPAPTAFTVTASASPMSGRSGALASPVTFQLALVGNYKLSIASGNNLTAGSIANRLTPAAADVATFTAPLSVLLLDSNGKPISGAAVTFTCNGAGIACSLQHQTASAPITVTTNGSGIATVGNNLFGHFDGGPVTLKAVYENLTATFNLTVKAPPCAPQPAGHPNLC